VNRVLVAHGTRKPVGIAMIDELADQVGALLDCRVWVAFVDVLGPTPTDVLRSLPAGPTVLVPAFLANGYHVHTDIPTHIAESGRRDVTVAGSLGPSPELVQVLCDRMTQSGWRSGDSVVLAAAGTSDPRAVHDLRVTATALSAATMSRVTLAYVATGEPGVADIVRALRRRGAPRVVIASYLLADGLFQDRLRGAGADIVTAPLGLHPGMVRLIATRFRRPAPGGDATPL
jgi:sirohydrochlorin ferrochelatase